MPAQGLGNASIRHFPGAPTGGCAPNQIAINDATGAFYDCKAGSWLLVGGGSIPGLTTPCSGTLALGTTAIASASKTALTMACTGLATTDNVMASFNVDPTATTGYIPSTDGMLTLVAWPTANTVNIDVINNTANSITPGASLTLNVIGVHHP